MAVNMKITVFWDMMPYRQIAATIAEECDASTSNGLLTRILEKPTASVFRVEK
jgi:hypothetical protein